jgi:lipopolysaccharide transport system permease protein
MRTLSLAGMLGWQNVRQAYRRSALGPFWITIGMAVQVATMGFVFGLIFKTDLGNYLPFLAVSIVIWGFISSSLNEGTQSFIEGEAIIKQLSLSILVHPLRVIWKNCVILAHNFAIVPIVLVVFGKATTWHLFLLIPGLIFLLANLSWLVVNLAMLSARYRDVPPIINSALTIGFYLTPVMWYPSLIGDDQLAHMLLGFNPFYHLLQIVRLPILGEAPTFENWLATGTFAVVGWLITYVTLKRFGGRIALWV